MKDLLVKDLKSLYEFYNTQYEIYDYTKDMKGSKVNIEEKGINILKNKKAVVLAIRSNGNLFIQSSMIKQLETFEDKKTLDLMNKNLGQNIEQGFLHFEFNNESYFGLYKYNDKWKVFILRAEERNEFYRESTAIFWKTFWISIIITLASAFVGILLLRYILRFIRIISSGIMKMIENQKMEIIDLKNAPNDDITFLGIAFNSLSNTIDNLVTIFRKFATRDVAMRAYQEREIRLEGSQQELAVLFSDIKSFTFITETLGTDIIKLLNMHYDKAIREILAQKGIIGSIIGDAILAVFGTLSLAGENKSYQAVLSAYKLQEVSGLLRMKMHKRKAEIVKRSGKLTSFEEKVFKAVLLEIGVGLDGGEVFYGNIGSYVRMTNTVIGDNVNSASRLEGLTRIYQVPVICSEYIKNDVEKNISGHKITFLEIDKVQVKGKTIGKTIYWPILHQDMNKSLKNEVTQFSQGLQLYYKGNWAKANKYFKSCKFSLAEVFISRTKSATAPKGWNGIWAMTTK